MTGTKGSAVLGAAARSLFPAALLLFAGLFFAGSLGWWCDDYWHCRRDPVTGLPFEWAMDRGFLLRPLFYVVVPALTTALWKADWAAHAIHLGWHGAVVLLLWRLMMMLGIGKRAAAAGALLFMMYPSQFEAVFWFSALPTAMSAAVMLVVMMLGVAFARGRVGWWAVVVMGVQTFVACCLNEQAASVAAAMPVLAWAAGRGDAPRLPPERGALGGWLRALAPGAVCCLACAAYLVMLQLSMKGAPVGARGSAESFVSLDRVGARAVYFVDVLWRRLVMKNWGGGALKEGWEQASGAWWAVAALVALGVVWAWAGRRAEGSGGDGAPGAAPARRGWKLVVLGLAVFAVGWLPILVMAAYEPDSRCRYWPNVGLAMVAAAAVDGAGRVWRGGGTAVAARLMLAAVLVVWGVMLVGAQSGLRNRWMMDRAEGESLRQQVPRPVPYTMFIPMHVESRALRTGSPVLDSHFRSVWEFPWSTRVFVERLYRRTDVRAGYWRSWTPGVPVRGGDRAGLHYADPNFGGPRFPSVGDGVSLVPWERAVLFTVGADGVLRVVTAVRLVREGAEDVVVRLPQAAGLEEWEVRMPRKE